MLVYIFFMWTLSASFHSLSWPLRPAPNSMYVWVADCRSWKMCTWSALSVSFNNEWKFIHYLLKYNWRWRLSMFMFILFFVYFFSSACSPLLFDVVACKIHGIRCSSPARRLCAPKWTSHSHIYYVRCIICFIIFLFLRYLEKQKIPSGGAVVVIFYMSVVCTFCTLFYKQDKGHFVHCFDSISHSARIKYAFRCCSASAGTSDAWAIRTATTFFCCCYC